MTVIEFHEKLNEIDFKNGVNLQSLDSYLLACLTQLEINKDQNPSYELFLLMFDNARNGKRMKFDPSWKKIEDNWNQTNFNKLTECEKTMQKFQNLAADLIHTKEVRSQPNYVEKEYRFDWDSESGLRFFNGTTPHAILKYTATSFIGKYHASAYQETKVPWDEFWNPIEIGINYE